MRRTTAAISSLSDCLTHHFNSPPINNCHYHQLTLTQSAGGHKAHYLINNNPGQNRLRESGQGGGTEVGKLLTTQLHNNKMTDKFIFIKYNIIVPIYATMSLINFILVISVILTL